MAAARCWDACLIPWWRTLLLFYRETPTIFRSIRIEVGKKVAMPTSPMLPKEKTFVELFGAL